MNFKCLMYNVFLHWPGYGNIIRANRIRTFLGKGDWDVIGLAEAYSESQLHMILNDTSMQKLYPYQLARIEINNGLNAFNTENTGLVLLSKHRIVKSELYIYKATQNKVYPLSKLSQKGVIYAEIIKDDKKLGIYLTHLFWGRTEAQIKIRSQQLQELKALVEERERDGKVDLILGDLNLMSNQYEDLMTIFDGFNDAWVEVHGRKDPGFTWSIQNTFVYFLLGNYRYDYILTSLGIETKAVNILKPKNTIKITPRKPLSELQTVPKTYYLIMRYLRYLFVPFGLVLHLWRIILRLPSGLFNPMDLSDHYPLEGEFMIE